jgi:hypothetical protein
MGLAGQIIEYRRGQKQLDDGNYRVVEGMVRDFIPMPPGGHSIESFKVGETPFTTEVAGGRFDLTRNLIADTSVMEPLSALPTMMAVFSGSKSEDSA